jgi:hypothetical protein
MEQQMSQKRKVDLPQENEASCDFGGINGVTAGGVKSENPGPENAV